MQWTSTPHSEGLVIVDYGSQYTLLIARRLRELEVYCEIIAPAAAAPQVAFHVKGVILSGGPDTVLEEGCRELPAWVMEANVPVLGICYGLQLLVRHFGGTIRSGTAREYGKATLLLTEQGQASPLWQGIAARHEVWMSHGDDIAQLPTTPHTFEVMARTHRSIAAIACREAPYFGLQYHPEVQHTQFGRELLTHFARTVCGLTAAWNPGSLRSSLLSSLRTCLDAGRVLVACSGGVDSTVALVLLSEALGPERVQGVLVDTGLLRWQEAQRIEALLGSMGITLDVLMEKNRFYAQLQGITDPEQKRKIIGSTFIEVFAQYAQQHRCDFRYLAQGTLYSDVIESGIGGAAPQVIKTHHNVGGLPDVVPFELVEPLRYLFKDEVRVLGKELGIPHDVLWQHPFPGPGLGVRMPGAIDEERVKILQRADAIFIQALHDSGLYDEVWQAFAVLLPVRSVGVMGDGRTYGEVLSLRAVCATDAMTAQVAQLPLDFLTDVAEKIVSQLPGVNRVLYDVTTKPPATIEWE